MIEIAMMCAVILLASKHTSRKRRYNPNFVGIRVNNSVALSTLADGAVLKLTLMQVTQEFYAITGHLSYSIRDLAAGEGPLLIGLAHGDYTVTEIKEAIEADQTSQGTKIEQEQTRRKVRDVGFVGGAASAEDALFDHGRIQKTKMGFHLEDGQNAVAWVQNLTGATLTTGAFLEVTGKIYGNWK